MNYFGLGRLAAIGLVMVVGAVGMINRSVNYTPAKGTVDTIDRECQFTETTTDPDGKTTARGITDSCNSTDEFKEVADSKKRTRNIAGKAVVHVSYTSPKDGSWQVGDLHFDGRDDEFYKLKAGDQVDILVSNDDPKKIMLD